MNIEYLATPIYQRAIAYLLALHVAAFLSACLTNSLVLALLAVGPFLAMLPGSLISLAAFKVLLAKINTRLSPAEIYNSVHIKALTSCVAGALPTVAVISVIMELGLLTEVWWYLPFPVVATWLAVFQKRKLIYKAIQEQQTIQSESLRPLQNQSPLC